MIFLDLETTGLLKPGASELIFQPFITEIYAVKLNDKTFEFQSSIDTFIKPPVPIPEHITKITGITDDTVAGAPKFIEIYQQLVDLWIGERTSVGHNVTFDLGVIWCELARCELEVRFPWTPEQICTVEKSFSLENKRLKLSDLHIYATGNPHFGAHRAKNDVYALITCFMWMKEQGLV